MNRKLNISNVVFSILVGLALIFQTGFLSGLPVSAQGKETDPPPPTLEPTKPPEPTATETASPTPDATETPLPSETPTPGVTETATVVDTEDITLSLSANPTFLQRGEKLTLDWNIEGMSDFSQGAILRFQLPPDVIPDPGAGTFNEKDGTLELKIEKASGSIVTAVGEKAGSPLWITAELLQAEKVLARGELELLEPNETIIESQGGSAEGRDGQVRATFPDGALSETVKVKIERPSKASLPVDSLSGSPFEITAVSENTKMEVSKFGKPVEIQVKYDESELSGDEGDLRLYWYDTSTKKWEPLLNQWVDVENNLLIASTDHFTVFDTYNSGWQSAETPTMSFFQHSGFTGAASFSMPIKVPAGPGGFQPSLSLSYSSQVVDSVTTDSQASWAGMGWSFDAGGYIERNGFGTIPTNDDSYSLNANGMSGELWIDANGQYHLADENFYKIAYNSGNDSWVILDKTGTQYYFEESAGYLRIEDCPGETTVEEVLTWRWMLKRVVNIYGQEMTYNYVRESQSATTTNQGCTIVHNVVNYIYPQEIVYANGRYRISFNRIARKDYKPEWLTLYLTGVYKTFQKSLLREILVEQDANGDGTFETLIRKYYFSYCATASCSIFPAYVWPSLQNYRTPTLTSVREYGLGGTSNLPAYTFKYDDGMHLTSASNGQGGDVAFTYDTWHETIPIETWPNGLLENEIPRWGNPLKCHFNDSKCEWAGVGNNGLVLGGSGSMNGYIRVNGLVEKPVYSYQPGRWYRMVAAIKAPNGTPTIQLGYSHKVNGVLQPDIFFSPVTLNTALKTIESEPFLLPRDTTAFSPRLNASGYSNVYWYYLIPVPTYARVTSRTLSTGDNSYPFTYDYQDPATNTLNNSDVLTTAHPYSPAYTEFRGYESVTENDPYGKHTTTVYDQTDCLKGRALNVTTRDSAWKIAQTSTTSYACNEWDSPAVLLDQEWPFGNMQFTGLRYRWVRTTDETSTVFDASGVGLVANKTTHYDYSTHGNLTQSTTSGTDVDTVITHTEYAPPNTSGKWLVGLPARTWTESGGTTLTESLNLYDGANTYNTMPTTGILTATRTLIDLALNRYSQTSMTRDDWGNVISQTTWSGYGTQSSAPASGARTTYTCFGGLRNNQVENLGGTLCQDDGYHTYALWMKDALGHKTTVNYSANAVPGASATGYTMGLPVSETDPNNATTSVTYDVFGRFTGLTKPGDTSPTLNVSYVNNPFKVTLTQTIDASQTFVAVRNYDGLGRQTSTVTNGVTVTSTFNAYGKPLTQSMPHASGAWYYTTTDYDSLGRPVTVTAPDTTTVNYAYDGLTNTVTDANNHSTTTVTDILGRTLSITPPATIDNSTPPVTFTYDALGNMLTATRGGATMTLTYDNAGRKKTMSDPDLGFWQYSYNALGGMTRQEDAKNQVSCLYYDELNRQRGKDYFTNSAACPSDPGSGYDVTYNYDSMADGNNGRGRRTSMTDASGSTRWIYDARGRVTKETKIISGTSFVTEWTLYNSADLPVTMKYPDGEFVTTTYDNNMLPKTTIGNATYVSNTNYDSAGRMTSRVLGNGLTQAYHYYEWDEKVNNIGQGGRLETLVTGSLQNLAYVYDKVGNIAQMTNSVAGETSAYGYDELDRLTSWALNGTTESYDYDDTGNLIDKNGLLLDYPDAEGSTPTHPHAVTSANASVYAYDNNGNQTTHTFGSDHFDLTYDAENRLVEVQKNDATIALFTYDGDGKRVKSVMDGETILFAGSHYEQKGSTITKYYFAGASRIAMRKYTIPQNMLVEYFLGDHLGSTSITADANGAMVSEMRYKPWGAVRYSRTDPDLNTTPTYELPKYTFTGQFSYVTEFGLMYYGARFYDVSTGRFVSADTIVPTGTQGTQAWDRYAFLRHEVASSIVLPEEGQDLPFHRQYPTRTWETGNGLL